MAHSGKSAPQSGRSRPENDHRAPSRAVRAVHRALQVEAAILVVGATAVVVDLVARQAFSGREIAMAAFLVACALAVARALVGAGRSLLTGRPIGRAVAVTWQLFQCVLGATAVTSGAAWTVVLGVVLLALAIGITVVLFMPRVVQETTQN